TFEYIMLKDVNDHEKEALELAKLLKPIRHLAYVNLIPYNPVSEHIQYERSDSEVIQHFHETLKNHHIQSGVRWENGVENDAPFRQLKSKLIKNENVS